MVAAHVTPRPHFELGLSQAAALGLGDDPKVGDDVGVELPLVVLCAIALANIECGALPHALSEDLAASGLKPAIIARLTLLRGTPSGSPELVSLRALVTAYGGDVVRWTMSVQADPSASPAPLPERLVLALEKAGTARLMVIPAVRGLVPRRMLLAAICPAPADNSLWCFLENEGARLLGVERVVVNSVVNSVANPVVNGVDPDVVVNGVVNGVDPDGVVNGVDREGEPLRSGWGTVDVIDGGITRLGVDPSGLLVMLDDDARTRVRSAAAVFRGRLDAREPGEPPQPRLAGSAVLRVLARAAASTVLQARAHTAYGVHRQGDGSFVVDGYGRTLKLVPSAAAVYVAVGDGFSPVLIDARVIDGDVEALRALCAAVADAIAGTPADVEVVVVDDDGTAEGATLQRRARSLSAWLRALGAAEVKGWLPWSQAATQAFQDVVDVWLEER